MTLYQSKYNLTKLSPQPGWEWFHDACVGAWIMDDQGETIVDYSRVGTDAVLDNSSGDISHIVNTQGKGLELSGDATNDRINLGSITPANPLAMVGKTAMTIITRLTMNSGAGPTFPRIFDKSDGGSGVNGYVFYTQDNIQLRFDIDNSGATTRHNISHTFSEDEPHIFSWLLRSLSLSELFVDGISVGTDTSTQKSFPSATAPAAIGNFNSGVDRMWPGAIDFLYVLGAVTPAQRRQIELDPYGPFRQPEDFVVLVPSVAAAGRIMSSLVAAGGLAGKGGIAGIGGGLAG